MQIAEFIKQHLMHVVASTPADRRFPSSSKPCVTSYVRDTAKTQSGLIGLSSHLIMLLQSNYSVKHRLNQLFAWMNRSENGRASGLTYTTCKSSVGN